MTLPSLPTRASAAALVSDPDALTVGALAVRAGQARGRRTAAEWLGDGAWAVLDQGLHGVANFALNVVLARAVGPQEYGAFATAYSLFLIVSVVHTALLVQPLIVFGAGKYHADQPAYLRGVLVGHWILTAAASLVLLVTAGVLALSDPFSVAPAMATIAVATPLLLLQWLMRRVCYVRMQPWRAAVAGALYLGLLLLGVWAVTRAEALSVMSAVGVMAVAGVLSVLPILRSLARERGSRVPLRSVARDHLRFGRWTLASGVLETLSLSLYFVLLPLLAGLESAAALKALMNLEMPLLQALSAVSVVLVGALVRMAPGDMTRSARRVAIPFILLAVVYWLVVAAWGTDVIRLVYGDAYTRHAPVLWIIGLLPIGAALYNTTGAIFQAMRRPDVILRATVVSGGIAFAVGIALVPSIGVAGAAAGIVLAPSLTALFLLQRLNAIPTIPRQDVPAPAERFWTWRG